MSNKPSAHPSPDAATPAQAGGMLARLRGIGIVPAVVITCIALVALGNLGFLLTRVAENHGLMPQPTAMETYACKGFAQAFTMEFRHGMDTVKLHAATVTLDGNLLNGKIGWMGLPAGTSPLGFAPPTEITYDDSNSLRVLDLNQTERICARIP
jgi:hypothetical protein